MFRSSLRRHARAIEAGNRTCANVAEDVIRARRAQRAFTHVYRTFDEEEIRRQSRTIDASGISHPLKALPVSVKDAYGVAGYPTFGGGNTAMPARWTRDTGIVEKLRARGVLFTGKTRMVELALGGLGHDIDEAPVNPWDAVHDRVCGGSSCGAGGSLLDGTAAVALAADIAGSVRIPASMTGVVGFRPTQGTWIFGDAYLGICPTLDGPGILTLSVADAQSFFGAIHGDARPSVQPLDDDGDLRRTRIGILGSCFEQAQPDVAAAAHRAVQELGSTGATLVDVSLPEFREAFELYMESSIAAIECAAFVDAHFPDTHQIHDPIIRTRLQQARIIQPDRYRASLKRRRRLMKAVIGRLSECDVFVTPTVPASPPRFVDVADPAAYLKANRHMTLMTNPINVLNLTALTMPVGRDASGLPVGLQLVGGPRTDHALLRIAVGAERVLGTPADILGAPPRLARFDDGIRLRDTPADELPAVCAAEAADANRQIVAYSADKHRQEWGKPDVVYKSIYHGDRFLGFVILVLDPDSRSVEFRRIVVCEPDRGVGTQVVRQVLDLCRRDLGRTRVWLDVFETNARARHVYEKAGFWPFGRSVYGQRALVLYEHDVTNRP